jgi:hypothetical protein
VASDLDDAATTESLDTQIAVFIAGVARRMENVPKALAELVIHSQHIQLMRLRAPGLIGTPTRFADLLCELLAEARARGELVGHTDPVELGEILGALTMDAIEAWATERTIERPLEAVLRSRFALVLDQFSVPKI